MSYAIKESSVSDGSPFLLVELSRGLERTYLTTEPEDVVREFNYFDDDDFFSRDDYFYRTWKASAISRSEVRNNGSLGDSDVTLSFPISDPFASRYVSGTPNVKTFVKIFRGHRGETELVVVYLGEVMRPVIHDVEIDLVCESVLGRARRSGLNQVYSRSCRHVLYGSKCGVNRADFEVAAIVTSTTGLTLTVPVAAGQPDQYYQGGIVDFGGELGFVDNHIGDTLILTDPIHDLAETVVANGTADVAISPGCDLAKSTCDVKFGNILNNGAFPRIPNKSPLDGSSIL